MAQKQSHSKYRDILTDIVYITLPSDFKKDGLNFPFDLSTPIPVQLPPGATSIDTQTGISIESIAAAIIKLLAYRPHHEHISYYRSMLLAMQPDVEQELQLAAIAKAKQKDYEFAEELFLAASSINPSAEELYVNLSILYGEQAQNSREHHDGTGFDYYTQKQVTVLTDGLENNQNSELLLSELGMLHLFLGNEEIALDYLNRYLTIATPSEKQKSIAKRAAEISRKIEDDTTLFAAFDEMQLGNSDQALRLVESFIEHQRNSWNGYFIKGWALRTQQRFEEAGEAFIRCLELGEKNADIYNELSLCMAGLEQHELAKDYMEIAVELEPDNVKLLTNLAFICLRDESYEIAHELYTRATSIDPNDLLVQHLGSELKKRIDFGEDDDVIDA